MIPLNLLHTHVFIDHPASSRASFPAVRGDCMGSSLLLIEDDTDTAEVVVEALRKALPGFAVRHAPTLRRGIESIAQQPIDCVLLDYHLPDGNGLDGLRLIRRDRPQLPVIMLTGAGSEMVAVEAMKLGAADYVVKQGRFVDTLPPAIRVALGQQRIAYPAEGTQRDGLPDLEERTLAYCQRSGLIGAHPAFQHTLRAAERAAQSGAPALIEGESGTGKERVAQLIHALGARHAGPFIAINCAALPEHLLESELFGHVRGAFSGAHRDHVGLFEAASGGTLFLDEVGELPLSMQPKLLRALQEHEVRPVGATRTKRVDVRVIAASNRDLRTAVAADQFRSDLFYRLHVLPIGVPALRERRTDLPMLAAHFVRLLSIKEGHAVKVLSPDTLAALEDQEWPGNIREFENEIHRLVVAVGSARVIEAAHLGYVVRARRAAAPPDRALKDIVRDVEAAAVTERLRQFGYCRTTTAKSLGLTREGLWYKLRQLGMGTLPGRV